MAAARPIAPAMFGRARLELVGELVVDGLLEGDRERSCRRRPGRAASPRAARLGRRARRCRWARTSCGRRRRRSRSRAPARRPARCGRRLGAVDQHGSAPGVGDVDDAPDRVDRAERVGDVGDRDELGARPDELLELVEQQLAGVVDGRDAQTGAPLLADHLPGDDVGVVLHRRDEHLVALAEMRSRRRSGPPG